MGRVQGREGTGRGRGAVRAAPVGLAPELAVPRAPGRTGLTARLTLPLGKLGVAAALPPEHSLSQKCGRTPERVGGGVRGGKRTPGGAQERRGPGRGRERGSGGGDPRIPSSKHLLGVSGGLGVGAAAPTLARPGCAQAAVRSEPPPDSAPRALRAAPRALLCAIGSPASEAHPPARPALRPPSPGSSVSKEPRALRSRSPPRSPAPRLLAGRVELGGGGSGLQAGRRGGGPRRPEPGGEWHARAGGGGVAEAAAGDDAAAP